MRYFRDGVQMRDKSESRGESYDLVSDDDLEIERGDLPALAGYYERLWARPAYREHVMVSYAELRSGAA